MENLKTKLNRIEAALGLSVKDPLLVIVSNYKDPVDSSIFSSKQEEQRFVLWRKKALREKSLMEGSDLIVYDYSGTDVVGCIEEFRQI